MIYNWHLGIDVDVDDLLPIESEEDRNTEYEEILDYGYWSPLLVDAIQIKSGFVAKRIAKSIYAEALFSIYHLNRKKS